MIKLPSIATQLQRPRPKLRAVRPVMRPLRFPYGAEQLYAATLLFQAKAAATAVRTQLLPKLGKLTTYAGKQLPRADDINERLQELIAALRAEFRIGTREARRWALEFLETTNAMHTSEFVAAYGNALNVNPMVGNEAWLPQAMDVVVEENVALIKSIPNDLFDQVEKLVSNAVLHGTRVEELALQIIQRFGVTENRALLIARDQVGKWQGNLNRFRQLDAGVTEYDWQTSGDERVRPKHRVRDGKRYRWASDEITPGQEVMCLPGDAHVAHLGKVRVAYRRAFRGQLTSLQTAHATLRCTPNHPVLTGRGWIAAQHVQVGDDVWHAGPDHLLPYEADVESVVVAEQAFRALAMVGTHFVVPGALGQFHGDAAVDEQVDAVAIDWSLPLHVEASGLQREAQLFLERADVCLPLLPSARALTQVLVSLGLPATSCVRGFGKALALLDAGTSHSVHHRDAASAWLDTPSLQLLADGVARDPRAFRDGVAALAGKVPSHDDVAVELFRVVRLAVHHQTKIRQDTPSAEVLAQIVGVDAQGSGNGRNAAMCTKQSFRVLKKLSGEFTAHVYNFQTPHEWYTAEGLIVHNCRCQAIPVIPDWED